MVLKPSATRAIEAELAATFPVDHIGIAVRDTDTALHVYHDVLGLVLESSEIDLVANLKVTFLRGANTRLEIIEPLPGDSVVARFLERRGEGMHHVCFLVPDIEATLQSFSAGGYQPIDLTPRCGRKGELFAFIHPKTTNGVLIELYQR